MRRLSPLACLWVLAAPAWAEETNIPQGYAFERPEVLADQRLWGIAHGARLLALACARAGQGAAAEAWVDWREREAEPINALRARLGAYYFQDEIPAPERITAALGLAGSLNLAPEILTSACDTLAETLAQPRYDLTKRREELLKSP